MAVNVLDPYISRWTKSVLNNTHKKTDKKTDVFVLLDMLLITKMAF